MSLDAVDSPPQFHHVLGRQRVEFDVADLLAEQAQEMGAARAPSKSMCNVLKFDDPKQSKQPVVWRSYLLAPQK